jgi:hypothetical protein
VIEIIDMLTQPRGTSMILLVEWSVAITSLVARVIRWCRKAATPYIWARSARLDAADTDTIENTFTHHLGAPGQEWAARHETLAISI